jgi:hypothetical protein
LTERTAGGGAAQPVLCFSHPKTPFHTSCRSEVIWLRHYV